MNADRKRLWLALGAFIGMTLGMGMAYLLWQEYEERGRAPKLDVQRGARVALVLLQSARRILSLLVGE